MDQNIKGKGLTLSPSISSSPSPLPSSSSPSFRPENDFVRKGINRILTERHNVIANDVPSLNRYLRGVTDDELECGLRKFQNLLDEAGACVKDCEEAPSTKVFEEEFKSAGDAVEEACSSYVELLEDFRRANEQQLQRYCDVRGTIANRLKLLRHELAVLEESSDNSSIS